MFQGFFLQPELAADTFSLTSSGAEGAQQIIRKFLKSGLQKVGNLELLPKSGHLGTVLASGSTYFTAYVGSVCTTTNGVIANLLH